MYLDALLGTPVNRQTVFLLQLISLLALVTLPGQSQTWTTVGDMSTSRAVHSLIPLPSGKILAAGEWNTGSSVTNATELYDPLLKVWSNTGATNQTHTDSVATLLQNGRVLLAGGRFGATALNGTEVYDPTLGQWAITGGLNTPRVGHTLTVLPGGKVLAVGGYNGASFLNSAELYDPATGSWTYTASMALGRWQHTATLLADGRVLIAGGENYGAGDSLRQVEIYDPNAGSWTSTGSLNAPRAGHRAGLLPDGRVLVSGGNIQRGAVQLNSTEIYQPATGTWMSAGGMSLARDSHTMTLLANGQFLVTGGRSAPNLYTNTAEIFNPSTDNWSSAGTMSQSRFLHAATLLNSGAILVSGGSNGTLPALKTAEEFAASGCGYRFAPSSQRYSASGGTGVVVAYSSPGCQFPTSFNVPWLSPSSGTLVPGGGGSIAVAYQVAPNTGVERTGTITIGGGVFTVNQSGTNSCNFSVSPRSLTSPQSGGTFTVSVSTAGGCSWSAVSNSTWIGIMSGASGSGPGSVLINVASSSGGPRTGSVSIAGYNISVSQSGSACGATDVTDRVSVAQGAFFSPFLGNYEIREITLSNRSSSAIAGPIYLVFDGLPRTDPVICPFGCNVYPATGITHCQSPAGSTLLLVSAGPLTGTQRFTITFIPGANTIGSPDNKFQYRLRILSGTPNQ